MFNTDPNLLQDILLRNLHLDLTRATEQTAITLSLLQGKGSQARYVSDSEKALAQWSEESDFPAPKTEYFEELGLRSMLGFLRKALCKGQIPEYFQYGDYKCWEQISEEKFFGELAGFDIEDYEFVANPVDGVDALSNGQAGAASVLAGGPKGTFRDIGQLTFAKSAEEDRFVVATISPNVGGTTQFLKDLVNREIPLCQLVGDIVQHCVEQGGLSRHEIAISFMQDGPERRVKKLPHLLRMLSRVRRQTGSRVLAALSPFFPELQISAFIDEVSAVQASIIAAGASANRGHFIACPIRSEYGKSNTETAPGSDSPATMKYGSISEDVKVFSATSFVEDRDVFVLATGITDSIGMKGTRFLGQDRAYTESLLLRKSTQSRRMVNTHHDRLSDRTFRFLGSDGELDLNYGADLFHLIREELKPPSKGRAPKKRQSQRQSQNSGAGED